MKSRRRESPRQERRNLLLAAWIARQAARVAKGEATPRRDDCPACARVVPCRECKGKMV